MMDGLILGLVLRILVIQVVILLLLRPAILWYLKISRAINALESIAESLEQLPAAREYRNRTNPNPRRVA